MAKLNIEVNGVSETVQKLRDGIEDGSIEGLDDVLDLGKETARSEVQQKRRPYTTPHLVGSFETAIDSAQRKGRIYNLLEYSAYVDKGVSGTQRKVPGSPFSYTDTMPPLDEMIKFVEERMGSWSLSDFDPPSGGDSASAGGSDNDGEDDGDGEKDYSDRPETSSEGVDYAREWKLQDPVVDEDDNVYRIIEEDDERGGYILAGPDTQRFVDYETAALEYDHSQLDETIEGNTRIDGREEYIGLMQNLAAGVDFETSLKTRDTLKGDDVVEFDILRGDTVYANVVPEELQEPGDGITVEIFALKEDSSVNPYQEEIVPNKNYRFGVDSNLILEPETEIKRVWDRDVIRGGAPYNQNLPKESNTEIQDDDEALTQGDIIDSYDDRFNIDFDADSPDSYWVGQKVAFTSDTGLEYSRPVVDVTDEYVELENLTGDNYRYYFGGTPEEASTNNVLDELDAIQDVADPRTLSEGDKVLVDAENIYGGPDNWEDDLVYAVVDGLYEDGGLNVHDIAGGYSDVTVRKEAYYADEASVQFLFDINSGDALGNSLVYEGSYSKKAGYVKNITNDTVEYKLPSKVEIIKDPTHEDTRRGNDYLKDDNILSLLSYNKRDAYNDFYQNEDRFSDGRDFITDFTGASDLEENERYVAYLHRQDEFIEVEYFRNVTGSYEFAPYSGPNSLSFIELEWDEDLTELEKLNYPITPVAKVDAAFEVGPDGNSSIGPEGSNLLWYGQEITYEVDGNTKTGYVADWNSKNIEVWDGEGYDKVGRYRRYGSGGKLTELESKSKLTETQLSEQTVSEFDYRVSKQVLNPETIEQMSEWVENDLLDSFQNNSRASSLLSNMTQFGDGLTGSTQGIVSGISGLGESQYELQLQPSTDSDGNVTGFEEGILKHELTHAVMKQGTNSTSNDIVDSFTFDIDDNREYPGAWPLPAFDDDGNFDQQKFDEVETLSEPDRASPLPNHDDLHNYLYSEGEGRESDTIGPADLKNIPGTNNPESEFEEKNFSDSDYDTTKKLTDLFDPEPTENLSEGDVIRIEGAEGGEKVGVFTGTEEYGQTFNTGEKEEIGWEFWSQEGRKFSVSIDIETGEPVTDDDGDGPTLTGVIREDFETNWYNQTSEWEPETDDNVKRLGEASNLATRRMFDTFTDDYLKNKQSTLKSDRVGILRGYASGSASEVTAGISEVLLDDRPDADPEIRKLADAHPELVQSYVNVFDPTDRAKRILANYDNIEVPDE